MLEEKAFLDQPLAEFNPVSTVFAAALGPLPYQTD
jgi:hypothetical protein